MPGALLSPNSRAARARTRETEGDTWRRRCFQPLAENPVQVHEGDNFQPRPSPISKDLVLSRRHCLCAQNRDRRLCLATRPRHYVWLPAEFVKKHWGQLGEEGSPDLRRQHALHGGKAASSRTGRIANSAAAPRTRSQSGPYRRFP